jgi:hypothetical protein
VRCGATVPIERTDVVGIGYRCDTCSATVHGEEAEVEDNVPPEERERLARQGKRKLVGMLAASGTLVAGPVVAALALTGPFGAAVAGLLGVYVGSSLFSAYGEQYYSQWKRYRKPALPPARVTRGK